MGECANIKRYSAGIALTRYLSLLVDSSNYQCFHWDEQLHRQQESINLVRRGGGDYPPILCPLSFLLSFPSFSLPVFSPPFCPFRPPRVLLPPPTTTTPLPPTPTPTQCATGDHASESWAPVSNFHRHTRQKQTHYRLLENEGDKNPW